MIFNSIEYLIFLPTVFFLYWLLKIEFKNNSDLKYLKDYAHMSALGAEVYLQTLSE